MTSMLVRPPSKASSRTAVRLEALDGGRTSMEVMGRNLAALHNASLS